jgi:hypothetical protein
MKIQAIYKFRRIIKIDEEKQKCLLMKVEE